MCNPKGKHKLDNIMAAGSKACIERTGRNFRKMEIQNIHTYRGKVRSESGNRSSHQGKRV